LSPPLEPLRPGGYDFARDMYFNRIGASGFVLGRIRDAEMPHAPSLRLRYATVVDGMREAIDQRIRAVLPGDKGAIASAVITGKRDAITPPVNEAMYVSGLAHVLSISGYHMAVVAGMIFFAVRALFALLPAFSNRHPIKKWAALAALGAAAFYLLLSGAGGCDPTLLHHGRHRAHRRHGRSPDAHLPHAHRGGVGGPATGAGGDRSSELPDVVCGDLGARRRLPAWAALDERRRQDAARREDCALGRTGDRRPPAGFASRRCGDHSLHRLSFSPHLALWRDRQSGGDASRVGVG
jgi:hypothetical protein